MQLTIQSPSPYEATILYLKENELEADVRGPNLSEHFIGKQIKYGVMGNLKHQHLLEKIQKVGTENFFAFPFPKKEPTELWVVEAVRMAGLAIQQGQEKLHSKDSQIVNAEIEFSRFSLLEDENSKKAKQRKLERRKDELQKERYKEALFQFTMGLKLQKVKEGETADIEQAIGHIQKEIDLLSWRQKSLIYLPTQKDIQRFGEILNTYIGEPDIYACFEDLINAEAGPKPCLYWMQALFAEKSENWVQALNAYLCLSDNNPRMMFCVEKAYAMLEKAILSDKQLNDRATAIKMVFQEAIVHLRNNPSCPPKCYICFNEAETDVEQWLEKYFVPDLDLIGVVPIVSFRDLQFSHNVANFREWAKKADIVVIVCTPELKAKCEEGKIPEIDLIRSRHQSQPGSIYPIYLKGSWKDSIPDTYLEPILGAEFSTKRFDFRYFSQAFELFAAMRKLQREDARKIANEFVDKVKSILRGEGLEVNVETS